MILLALCVCEPGNLAIDIVVSDVGKPHAAEREVPIEEAPIASDRARPVVLFAVVEILGNGVVPGDRFRPMPAECDLGQTFVCYLACLLQRQDRIASQRDQVSVGSVLHDEAFRAALRDATTEVREAVVEVNPLPFFGWIKRADTDVR